MTSITAAAPSATIFAKLLLGMQKLLEVVGSAGVPEEVQASGLSARLSYDVGLSDLCPDRMVSTRCAEGSGDYGREMMRRGF